MKKAQNFEVTIDELVYEPHIITVYAPKNATDEELTQLATNYILTHNPVLTRRDLATDSPVIEVGSEQETPDVVVEGLTKPKSIFGVQLGLKYAQAVRHVVEIDDEFDEVTYSSNSKDAKQFPTYEAASEFAKWLNPTCEVVRLTGGAEND